MKTKTKLQPALPDVTARDVARGMAKTATINLRVTEYDKEEMAASASAAGMTLTEYLIQCHRLVARRIEHLHRNGRG